MKQVSRLSRIFRARRHNTETKNQDTFWRGRTPPQAGGPKIRLSSSRSCLVSSSQNALRVPVLAKNRVIISGTWKQSRVDGHLCLEKVRAAPCIWRALGHYAWTYERERSCIHVWYLIIIQVPISAVVYWSGSVFSPGRSSPARAGTQTFIFEIFMHRCLL